MTIYFDNKCCFRTTAVLPYNSSFKFDCTANSETLQLLVFRKFKIDYYLKPHTFARIFTLTARDAPFYCRLNNFFFLIFFIAQNKIF